MTPPANTSALQAQLDSLGERMDKGFDELKALLRGYEERMRGLETREAGCQPIITQRMDAAWREINEHNTRLATKSQQINSLDKQVEKLAEQIKQVASIYKGMQRFYWAVGIPAILAVAGFLVALITGQAQVVFR